MTRAIAYTELGAPDVLRPTDRPTAAPGPGAMLIGVTAAGVNPIDAKLRSGLRPSKPIVDPVVPGSDGAGVVRAVGAGVDGFAVGDAVVFRDARGTYAEETLVDARDGVPRPAGVSAEVGAALGVPVGTAYQALRSLNVRSGDTLLVHAGSGAVGQAAIQFAVLAGARVIATTSDARAERVRQLGAEPVAYGAGLEARVRALAPEGVTVSLDAAGTDEAIETSLAVTGDTACIATIVRGADAPGFGIRAFGGGSRVPLSPQQLAWRREALPLAIALLSAGAFSVEDPTVLPLSEAAEAHRRLDAGGAGKIVLLP